MAEGEGFEPPVRFPVRLISSQVPSTTQPPFHSFETYYPRIYVRGKLIWEFSKTDRLNAATLR
jgi:hypothetical protein